MKQAYRVQESWSVFFQSGKEFEACKTPYDKSLIDADFQTLTLSVF